MDKKSEDKKDQESEENPQDNPNTLEIQPAVLIEDPNWENQFELLERVLSFLDSNDELNTVLAGYF